MTTTHLLGEASGVRPAFDFDGQSYRVGWPTQAAKARYESLIVACERDAIERMAADGMLTPADRREAYATLTRQVQEQGTRVGGAVWYDYFAGSKQKLGFALYYLAMVEVVDASAPGGFRPAGIGDLDAAVGMLTDEAVGLAFAEVLPPFAILLLAALPARLRETDAIRDAVAKLAELTTAAAPLLPPTPAESPSN